MQAKAIIWLLIFESVSQNLCWVPTGHTAMYRVNLQRAVSVTPPFTATCCAVLPAISSLQQDGTVLDMLSLLEAAKSSCPAPPVCTMVRQQCRCWQAGMTDSWPSWQVSSCVDTECGAVIASAVLAGWFKKHRRIFCVEEMECFCCLCCSLSACNRNGHLPVKHSH